MPPLATITFSHWLGFAALVVFLLALDLLVFHRHAHEPSLRESAGWSVFWIALALAFNGLVWWWFGRNAALDYLSGYLLEKSLSMDNVFVFAVVFRFFQVPRKYQYNVLFWGILGAVFMRLAFILAGAELIQHFHWVMPVFGAFLVYTAVKLAGSQESQIDPDRTIVLRLARRWFRVSHGNHAEHGQRFFVRESGRLVITPLFLVLLVVESTDVLFAVDSVPAILGVVDKDQDYFRFIAFSSNVFAILGLRALYFLLAGMIEAFRYLHYGLAAVLGFVGLKMIAEFGAEHWLGREEKLISSGASLAVIAGLLVVSIVPSLLRRAADDGGALPADPDGEAEPADAPQDPPA